MKSITTEIVKIEGKTIQTGSYDEFTDFVNSCEMEAPIDCENGVRVYFLQDRRGKNYIYIENDDGSAILMS